MYIWMDVYIYIYIHTYICIFIFTYVYIYACISTSTCLASLMGTAFFGTEPPRVNPLRARRLAGACAQGHGPRVNPV